MASIYHYTSGTALLGIISNSEFWATDIKFLNDHGEHVLGYEACIQYVEELKGAADDSTYGPWIKSLYQQLLNVSKSNVIDRQTYVVSFSKIVDSIAHWFSYCEKNQGYCIEFEEDLFLPEHDNAITSDYFIQFEDVNYADSDLLRTRLNEGFSSEAIVNRMLSAQKAASLIGIDVQDQKSAHADKFLEKLSGELMRSLISPLMVLSCSYKDDGFLHEKERRLFLIQNDMRLKEGSDPVAMKFREKNGAIYPYVPVKFNKKSIKGIVIGPCTDYEFKKAGLLKLLKFNGIDCEVRQSTSSLRFA